MIRAINASKHFGGLRAVDNVTLSIDAGNITGLIGPNGAGKTTFFNTLAGLYPLSDGEIFLFNEPISHLSASQRFDKGILRTFQLAQEFFSMTVLENLMMVPSGQLGENLLNTWIARHKIKQQEEEIRAKALEVIQFLNLEHLSNELAGNLSGGQKKLLELARTMMVEPKIILLDEIGAGVNKTLLKKIGDAILRLKKEKNYTFCMIEHDLDFIERLCDKVIVMADGQLLAEGNMASIKKNEAVIEAYLGR